MQDGVKDLAESKAVPVFAGGTRSLMEGMGVSHREENFVLKPLPESHNSGTGWTRSIVVGQLCRSPPNGRAPIVQGIRCLFITVYQLHGCSVFLSCVLGQFGLYQLILGKLRMKHGLYKMSACEDLEKH